MNLTNQENLIEMSRTMSLNDLMFLLQIFEQRLSVYVADTKQCCDVESIYFNGAFIELKVTQ
jgi:hypothetical protein